MDVKFDSAAATALIRDLYEYCDSVSKEAKSLLTLTSNNSGWNDRQYKAFQNNTMMICRDLEQALKYEWEYATTFQTRVKELR